MLTRAEKGYLALTLFFLATGSGIKACRHAGVRIGPFADPGAPTGSSPAASDSALGHSPGDSISGTASESNSTVSDSAGSDPARVNEALNPPDPSDPRLETSGSKGRPARPHPTAKPAGKSAFSGKVDVNRADAVQLTQVKGIGAKTADEIVAYRRAHGPFRELRDLLQVKGIGEKKLEKLGPFLIL
jgi:competence ComEA-like helix-hairpin-helix protein